MTGKQKGKAEKKEARKARRQEASENTVSSTRRAPPTQEELAGVGAYIDTGYIPLLAPPPPKHTVRGSLGPSQNVN